jgi:hypothetical protein
MAYTIFQVIKALPLTPDIQDKLIKDYPEMPEENQAHLSRVAWKAFYQLGKEIETVLRNRLIEEIANGKREVDDDLERVLAEEVEKELQVRISGVYQDDDRLAVLRKELEKYIQTM